MGWVIGAIVGGLVWFVNWLDSEFGGGDDDDDYDDFDWGYGG